jgi:nitroreductase
MRSRSPSCLSPAGRALPLPPEDLYEVMRAAPSTRRFKPDPVPRELLERVFENARFAPSGGNRQGWRVIVITDREKRRRLRELYAEPWDRYMEQTGGRAALDAGPESGLPQARLRSLQAADDYAHHFDEVPMHLVMCVELEALAITDAELDRPSIVGGASIYPFVQNVLLGLRHEGLGASFTTLLVPAEPQVRELLAIPEGVAMAGHISVGYREDPWPKRLSRKPVSDFAFGERYGEPW